MEEKIDLILHNQCVMLEQMSKLTCGEIRLEEGQNKLIGRVDKLEEGQARLEEGQNKLIERVDKLEEGQARLEEGQNELNQKVDDLKEGQEELISEVSWIHRDYMKTKEVVKKLNEAAKAV